MRRFLILFFMLSGLAFAGENLQAQMYMYNIDKVVDADGATIRSSGTRYFLFSGNKVFEVTKDGVKFKDFNGNNPYYRYKSSKNGNDYYYKVNYELSMNYRAMTIGYVEQEDVHRYLIVKADKSKMNEVIEAHVSNGYQVSGSTSVMTRTSQEAIDKAKRDALPDLIE